MLGGDYTLCYRVTGAKDSVAQSGDGVKLQAGKNTVILMDKIDELKCARV